MTQRITIDPDPPEQGKAAKVCYNFKGTGLSTVTLELTWDPDTLPGEDITLTPANNCKNVQVPATAVGGFITGPQTDDLGFVVDG